MFKRIKENPKYEKFKELWDNPRTHSMIVLGIWLVFMAIAIIFVRMTISPSNVNVEVTPKNNDLSVMESYDFTYKTNDLLISGQTYDESMIFYLNNHRYYYKDNVYIIDDENAIIQENFDLNILKINASMLNNLISDITPTTGDGFEQYVVPLDRFINLYEIDTDVDLSLAMNYNVVVTIYSDSESISKVDIDLTNYRLFKYGNNASYLLTIYYYNINDVSDFTKGFNDLIEVKE